jgi:hypothetical protein
MRAVITTASDDVFMPITRGLIESLHQWNKTGPLPADIVFFDLGLSPENREWVSRRVTQIIVPEWDLPVSVVIRKEKPSKRAVTIRPFLPKYLPGYDVYIWIDADTWIQEEYVIHDFLRNSEKSYLTLVAENHPSYVFSPSTLDWIWRHMAEYYGAEAVTLAQTNYYYNCGIMAIRADAPHWEPWAKWFRYGLERTGGTSLVDDQNPLNYTIWIESLPIRVLPARYNWLCHLSLPGYDSASGKLCDPTNQETLGLIHLSAQTKDDDIQVRSKSGEQRSLRFSGGI